MSVTGLRSRVPTLLSCLIFALGAIAMVTPTVAVADGAIQTENSIEPSVNVTEVTYDAGETAELTGVTTTDSGFLLAGTTRPAESRADALLIEVSPDGDEQWRRTLGAEGTEEVTGVVRAPDGGYVIAGRTTSNARAVRNAWALKIDADGQYVWDTQLGGPEADGFNAITRTSNGGYALAGYTRSYGTDAADGWVVKLNESGAIQWRHVRDRSGNDAFRAIAQRPDGTLIAGGFAADVVGSQRAGLLVGVAANGTATFNELYAPAIRQEVAAITAEEAVRAAGWRDDGGNTPEPVVFTVDGEGRLGSEQTRGDGGVAVATALTAAGDDYVVAGDQTAPEDGGFVVSMADEGWSETLSGRTIAGVADAAEGVVAVGATADGEAWFGSFTPVTDDDQTDTPGGDNETDSGEDPGSDESEPGDDGTDGGDSSGPGFGVLAVATAVAVLSVVARRKAA